MKPVRKDYYPRIEEFINAYRKSYGTAPSIKEIAAMLQVSNATAWRYVQRMAQEGIIEYQGGYGRIMTMQDQQPEQFVDVPAVGAVSCGLPAFAEENIEEYVRLPRKWVGSGNNVFILRADGHSTIKMDGLTVLSCTVMTSVMNIPLRFVMEGNTDSVRILLINLIWLFATVFIFVFHVLVLERSRQTARVEVAKAIAEREHREHMTLKRNLETMRAMAHDMKYYIEALQRTGMPDRMATNRIEEAVRIYEETFDTGCEALDLLLSDKAVLCASQGILLICSADASRLNGMDVGDLYSLFGNALDNAVEYLQTVAEPEKRYIRLEVKEAGGFVSFTLRNYCTLPPMSAEAFETTKADKQLHGYGIPNIRSIAARYDGDLRIERTGTEFVLRVLMQIS